MGITIALESDDQQTIVYTVEEQWSWNEYFAALKQAHDMMDSVPHTRIDIIIDMRRANLIPQNALSTFRRSTTSRHPKSGIMVFVGGNMFIKTLFRMMETLAREAMKSIKFVSTMEEAQAALSERRAQEVRET